MKKTFFAPHPLDLVFLFLTSLLFYLFIPLGLFSLGITIAPLYIFLPPLLYAAFFVFYVEKVKKEQLRWLNLPLKESIKTLLIGGVLVLVALSFWSAFFSILWNFLGLEMVREQSMVELFRQGGWVRNFFFFIGVAIFAPLAEECLFRGTLLEFLKERISLKKAVIVSSFLFTALHMVPSQGLYNIELFCTLFTISLILSFLYLKGKGLCLPVFLHGVINGVSFAHCLISSCS